MIAINGHFSANDLSETLRGLGKDTYFVQIGAMDGVTYDPVHSFIEAQGWHGLLVEPIPYLHKKLKENYAGCVGLDFAEEAITDFDGNIDMSYIDPSKVKDGVFLQGAFGASTIMLDKGLLGGKNIPEEAARIFKQNISKVNVPCSTLKTLFAKFKISKLDFMIIDTEGADWMIARQLDLIKFRPRVVYLEFYHLSDYEKIACANHFKNHSYSIYLQEGNQENFMAVYPS